MASKGCGKAEALVKAPARKACSGGKGGSGEHSCSQRNACAHGEETTRKESTLCLAVVRENGTDIVLLDAAGIPKTFRYEKNIRDLCFKPHGSVDGSFLTPCLDDEGKHGVPEESCFCGVETPHIHAHLRGAHCDEACDDPAKLATHILHPLVEEIEPERSLLNIGVSDAMPKECNSQALIETHSSNGSYQGGDTHHRRMHAVQHEDHVDYLVHNAETGNLHLEHACDGCGHNDVHGTFQNIGQRRWKLRRHGKKDIHVHFFEIAPAKFNILDHLKIFSLESDRVKAVGNIMDSPSRRPSLKKSSSSSKSFQPELASSVLLCNGICCAAEIPIINRILEPIKGVKKVRVNVSLKQVFVDYDATLVSATAMTQALNVENLDATIELGGGLAMEPQPVTGKSTFFVEHICCASEIPVINQIIEPITGVSVVTINVTSKTVYVTHDTQLVSAQAIRDALNKQGFAADIRKDAGHSSKAHSMFCESILSVNGFDEEASSNLVSILTSFLRRTYDPTQIQMERSIVDLPQKEIKVVHNPFSITAQSISSALFTETGIQTIVKKNGADPSFWDLSWLEDTFEDDEQMVDEPNTYPKPAVVLSGVCWLVSMLSLAEGNLTTLKWVGLASVAFGLPAIAIKAFRTMSRYQFDANCLMLFASCGAVALQEYNEAAAVVFLFTISEWLEVRATARARHALSAIVHLRPEKANLVHPQTRQLVVIPASAVPVGALVSVKTGDKIPCDGIVVEGTTTVDESSLTGEARPIRKGLHDVVSGGTVNSGMAQIMVRTTSTSENSAVSRLIRLVEEAQANRSDTEKLVDEFAKIYTPFVVLAAVLMCSVPWAFGQETGRTWTENGLILIVVACPCAMIISTPVSYVAGLAATAQNGILIKGGAHLEALSLVKHICFDKTGTLTNGEFALLSLEDFAKNMSRKEVFEHLALMEERASHPVAQAILTGARNEKVSIPKDTELERHTIIAGEGVLGIINGREVHVGNERMFGRIGLLKDVPETVRAKVESWKGLGGTIGYMSIEGEGIVCAYCAADGVRAESASVVSRLRKCGIEVTMLTGDNRDAALAVGAQVGLSEQEIQSKLLPEEKLAFIESLSSGRTGGSILSNPCGQRRLVMMCGDGVNDAPALAAADIGVAMGAGAALAMETADIALLDSNLEKLEYSIRMGQRVTRKIKENVAFSLTVKFVVLGFALAGLTHLWAAIASDVGAMILVTLNAMLLLPKRQREEAFKRKEGDIEQGRAKIKRQDSHSTLPDDAAQGPGEVKVYKVPCEKGCCETETKARAVSHTACQKNCFDTEKTAPAASQVAFQKGYRKAEKKAATTAVSQAACQKGCCDTEKATTAAIRHAACQKGCCDTEKATTTAISQAACQKGCCDTEKATTAAVSQAACQKGCCDTEKASTTAVSQAACAEGCCDTEKATTAAVRQAACQKGCCDTEKATTTAISQEACQKGCGNTEKATTAAVSQAACQKGCGNTEKATTAAVSQAACQKGCCDTEKAAAVRQAACQKGCGNTEEAAAVRQAACQKRCCDTEKASTTAVSQAACAEGCCDTEKATTAAVRQAACQKGCCDTEKATTTAISQEACQKGCGNTEKATTAAISQAACQKGCCDTEKATGAVANQASCKEGCCDSRPVVPVIDNCCGSKVTKGAEAKQLSVTEKCCSDSKSFNVENDNLKKGCGGSHLLACKSFENSDYSSGHNHAHPHKSVVRMT